MGEICATRPTGHISVNGILEDPDLLIEKIADSRSIWRAKRRQMSVASCLGQHRHGIAEGAKPGNAPVSSVATGTNSTKGDLLIKDLTDDVIYCDTSGLNRVQKQR